MDEEAEWKMSKTSDKAQPEMSETPAASSRSDPRTAGSCTSAAKRARPSVAEPAVSRKKSFSNDVFAALQGDGSSRSTKRNVVNLLNGPASVVYARRTLCTHATCLELAALFHAHGLKGCGFAS
eukprot:1699597-Amphidinium_carterae.1